MVIVCGRYEGFDERVLDYVDEEISLGDYVLTGGELAAMVITDAVARQVPGVVGAEDSVAGDSLANGLSEIPAVHTAGRISRLQGSGRTDVRRP